MAKSTFGAVALVAALCLASLVGFAHCHDYLYVEGKVYCDTCRVRFETKLTESASGVVRLECRNREVETNVTVTKEVATDNFGGYSIPVEGDHEDEICEVRVVKSLRHDCNEIIADMSSVARVALTRNCGSASPLRFANPLGVLKNKALPACGETLRELGFFPLEF